MVASNHEICMTCSNILRLVWARPVGVHESTIRNHGRLGYSDLEVKENTPTYQMLGVIGPTL